MKKLLLALFILSSFNSKGTIHQIQVWNGYMQFLPPNNIIVQLGDTIQWTPLDPPTMSHSITSNNIPAGAVPFDQIWQMPADTFFQYIPQVAGLYQYVCTPHIPMGMIGEFTVINVSNTQTYVPDDNFENALINIGLDNILDNYVATASIDTVTILNVSSKNIADLTGIEDFTALLELNCSENQLSELDASNNTYLSTLDCSNNYLTSLNLSQNTSLTLLRCYNNQLSTLDVKNGNNIYFLHFFSHFSTQNNPNLYCINVDDATWSTANWTSVDPQHYFSNNCSPNSIEEHSINKQLLKVTDLLGREAKQKNQTLFYIYDDGTVEKKIIID
jgi:plastocyanin